MICRWCGQGEAKPEHRGKKYTNNRCPACELRYQDYLKWLKLEERDSRTSRHLKELREYYVDQAQKGFLIPGGIELTRIYCENCHQYNCEPYRGHKHLCRACGLQKAKLKRAMNKPRTPEVEKLIVDLGGRL